jgi:HSP20 family protein
MVDQHDQRFTILSVLVAGLLVAVIVQSVAIVWMHKKLDAAVQSSSMSSASVTGNGLTKLRPKTSTPINPSGQNKDPFPWDLDDGDPFLEMHSIQDRINQMFGSAFNRFQRNDDFSTIFRDHPFAPDINIEDKGDHFLVTVDLPGSEDSQLDVKLEGQTLTISGSVQSQSRETGKGKMLRQERRSGNFHRSVSLPCPVKADKMTTDNKKGVVTITIPKATE